MKTEILLVFVLILKVAVCFELTETFGKQTIEDGPYGGGWIMFFGSDRSPRSHNLCSCGSNLSRALNLHLSSSNLQAVSQQSLSSQSAVSQRSVSCKSFS